MPTSDVNRCSFPGLTFGSCLLRLGVARWVCPHVVKWASFFRPVSAQSLAHQLHGCLAGLLLVCFLLFSEGRFDVLQGVV